MYLDAAGNVIRNASTHGHLAVGVPGTVAGLEYAREKYGTLSARTLIAPAIALAEHGFVLDQGDVALLATATDDFQADPATAAIFLNNGQPYKVGDRLVQKDLARTLRLIAQRGADGFYQGPSPTRSSRRARRQRHHHQGRSRAVPRARAGAARVRLPRLSRRLRAAAQLRRRRRVRDPEYSRGLSAQELGFRSAQAVHYQIEAMRHAYVDRNSYLGDPDFVKNPLDRLLDKDYAEKIRAAIDPNKAGDSRDLKPGVAPHEGSNTTHYSIVDRQATRSR